MGGDGAKVSRLMCRSLAPIVLSSESRFLPAWGERTYSHIFSRMTSSALTPLHRPFGGVPFPAGLGGVGPTAKSSRAGGEAVNPTPIVL